MSEKLKIVYRPLQELSPYAHNARTHSTEQVAQLVESIKQFGWTNPVLIDEKGEIIAGHGRVMAAEMLKMDSVPVIVLAGDTTYREWFLRQPYTRQKQIVGETRAKLIRDGGMSPDEFYTIKANTRIATVSGNTSLITAKAEQQGEWTYYEATYTANTDIDTVNCAFYMTNKISNEPFYDDSTLTMTTPQIELGNTASSFIVTTMPTTRASDVVTIPSANNLSTRPFTVLCEVRRNWSTPPNVAPRIFDVGGHSIDDNYLSLGFVSTGKISANVGMVQPQISSDGERFIVGVRAKSDLSVNAICNGNYTTNLNGKIFGVTATSYRFGGQTAAGTRHLFGHIRNFRVWFKELNDRQIKEAV